MSMAGGGWAAGGTYLPAALMAVKPGLLDGYNITYPWAGSKVTYIWAYRKVTYTWVDSKETFTWEDRKVTYT